MSRILSYQPSNFIYAYQNRSFFLQISPQYLEFGNFSYIFSCNIITRGQNAYVGIAQNRTFGNCRRNYERFIAPPVGRKKMNHPKDFFNCVHPPLIQANADVFIMELLIPPPLHLFLGLGNRIFDKLHQETMELKKMINPNSHRTCFDIRLPHAPQSR